MESVVAGGILLVLGIGGGIKLDSRLVRLDSPVPQPSDPVVILGNMICVQASRMIEQAVTAQVLPWFRGTAP
jgi:hypothetical protein